MAPWGFQAGRILPGAPGLAGHPPYRQHRKHFLKVAALSKSTLTPQTSLPFNAIESRFLIGRRIPLEI